MAITRNTRPTEYSSRGVWVATSSQVEDSTHVNVRVESQLMVGAVAVAKKVKPKSLTEHDYTEILRSLVGFSTPNPLNDAAGINIIDQGITGSNLITNLYNNYSSFSTFSATGNLLNSALTATSVTAAIGLNSIAVTKGKIYCLYASGITPTGTPTLDISETSSIGINTTSLIVTYKDVFRIFIQPRSSGNMSLQIGKTAQIGGIGTTTFELYEMNECDWYVPYYMVFTEKWENGSGITQIGDIYEENNLRYFFDMPSVIQADVADYTLSSSSKIFMMNASNENSDGFSNYTGSSKNKTFQVYAANPGSNLSTHFFYVLVGQYTPRLRANYIQLNEAGTQLANPMTAYATYYGPIVCLVFDESICFNSPNYIFRSGIRIDSELGDTPISDRVYVICDQRVFIELYSIVWKNDKGGYSTSFFTNGREQDRKAVRVQYKDLTGLNKTLDSVNKNVINIKKEMTMSEVRLSYFADLPSSKEVYWHRGAGDFVPINIVKDSFIMKSNNMEYPELDFEYIA